MARVAINTGATPNDGTGDSLRAAGGIINNNFLEIYTHLGAGSTTILPAPIWDITSVGINTLKNVGIGTTNPRFALEVGAVGASGTTVFVNGDTRVTGIVTANSFRGSGTNLTGIVTSIVAGTNVTISGSTGQVTINASGGGGSGISTQWATTAAGINTLSNVGIGTTNPRFSLEVGAVGASGTTLLVNGDARITGILTVGTASITIDGSTNTLTVPNLVVTNSTTGVTASGVGISVRDGGGDLGSASIIDFGDNLTVSFAAGIATITGAAGGGSPSQWATTAAGINTLSNVGIGTTNPTSALTVKGNTSLETLNVSGIATFQSGFNVNSFTRYGDGVYQYFGNSDDLLVAHISDGTERSVVSSSTGHPLQIFSNDLSLRSQTDEIFASFASNGSASLYHDNSKKFETLGAGVTVTGTTFTDQLSVSGVSTFSGNVQTNGSNIKLGDGNEVTGNQIRLGNGSGMFDSDFWIYHNSGYGNLLQDITGAGVEIWTGEFKVSNPSNPSENILYVALGGGTELYYNRNKKFETLGAGVTVTGTTFTNQLSVSGVSTFSGNDIDFTYNGSTRAYWDSSAGTLEFKNGGVTFGPNDEAGLNFSGTDFLIKTQSLKIQKRSFDVNLAVFTNDDSVELYYDGLKKFETLGAGVTVTGTTFTNQLSVSGVSTFMGSVGIGTTNPTSKLTVNGGIQLAQNNETIVGTSGTVGEIKRIGGAPFFYDGSAWREFVLSSGTPVSVPADTEWDNVVFRATFDTDFTDAKFGATPVYVSAGSTIVGAAVTIGTGAFRNNGTLGAGVSYAYRSDYDFTGSWTIEFWMYVDSGPVYTGSPTAPTSLISMNSTTGIGTSGNWSLADYRDQYGNVYINWYNQNHPTYKNGIALYNVSGAAWNSVILDKWNHFALVREGDNGSLHFYVNGTEESYTAADQIIDNDILDISGNGLHFGGDTTFTIGDRTFNSVDIADVIFDDVRISAGVGTAGQRYNSVGIWTAPTFTPPTTALPTTGTLSSYIQPPGDKYGEITLGGSPTWRGTSGVTVSQQSSGNYRVSFASSYTNYNDYFVLTQPMDQGFASYVGVARSTTHVDFAINKESDNAAVNTGSLSVQIKNHI